MPQPPNSAVSALVFFVGAWADNAGYHLMIKIKQPSGFRAIFHPESRKAKTSQT
jgi:hypothetical protein